MNIAVVVLAALLQDVEFSVSAGKHDRSNVPITVPIPAQDALSVTLRDDAGLTYAAQVAAGALWFVLPQLKAGESRVFRATLSTAPPAPGGLRARWVETPGEHSELRFGERPVLRYMLKPLDESKREETYKVYHHVFDPSGERLLTKGPGGQYTHHRGLFYGFKCTYGGKTVDTWHCTKGTHLAHDKVLSSFGGALAGGHRLQVRWHGDDKEVFAIEERELTAWNVPGGLMIDFSSRLRSVKGAVKVGGDPQHAGFHFRADNEVSGKTAKQTYYLRPDGAGKPGETRNWSPKTPEHKNLPWNAMSFVLGDKRYTVAYLDHPKNAKEARYSERDYGRFGSYFEAEFDETKTLDVRYRLWIQEGEMTVKQVERLSADFTDPPAVTVK